MSRLRFVRGFLRTLIGLDDRSGPFWGIDRTVASKDFYLFGAALMVEAPGGALFEAAMRAHDAAMNQTTWRETTNKQLSGVGQPAERR